MMNDLGINVIATFAAIGIMATILSLTLIPYSCGKQDGVSATNKKWTRDTVEWGVAEFSDDGKTWRLKAEDDK